MRGDRLRVARKKAEKVFEKYHPKDQELRMENYSWYKPWTKEQLDRVKGIYRKTKVFCSDICCGNPRRHKIKTHKDKKDMELRDFEIMELESMEIEDYFDGLRIGESDFYGD